MHPLFMKAADKGELLLNGILNARQEKPTAQDPRYKATDQSLWRLTLKVSLQKIFILVVCELDWYL